MTNPPPIPASDPRIPANVPTPKEVAVFFHCGDEGGGGGGGVLFVV